MLFSTVVDASRTVAGTRSRRAKSDALRAVLEALAPDEVEPVVSWLSGELTQGRIGVGWRTIVGTDASPVDSSSLTVADVQEATDLIARASGRGSAALRRELLAGLLGRATDDEQRFLVQVLGGELRQGALEGVMIEAIAAAAGLPTDPVRRAVMLSGRLPDAAAAALDGGVDALAAFRLEVGRPVRPMLASPAASLESALGEFDSGVSVEYKLDGARIQVHRNGDRVWVFTRTLRDITGTVPELVELVAGLPVHSVVLDGETLALTDAGRPRPFQETMSRFGATSTRELLLHPYFFDCLHVDGEDLLDLPLSTRLQALDRAAPGHRIPALHRPDAAAAGEHLESALSEGHEGVMVKALDAPYAAGRRGRTWQKVKPEHTLDLVVLGAEWGYGRRTGYLSNLHLGARDPDGGPPIMVGKTFKGLTDALLRWQTEEFPLHESHRDEHTVHLRPELVVEIELDGVQTSTRYPGGLALRFARVLRYRPDKAAADADTIDAVRALLRR
ncbi:ATP-dependent DNA ligase [Rhodococcus triatomae]|uniref:Probable DNA ligase n=1 Tax=Rhodococcus triatomae TaxID=300028 RepID=A0A1G8GWS4_9NOCA|nr:ATP-dependent DNA ligase [Rhodococcus triatomae]QNG20276.1 ATP-dependent DNA ligase [Rhodococcus triatomae]QNG23809.1 ATP-dependent DNA ligase [Rhodococcus triatomae]SDH98853.1 DNA ligase-1 [Rhodococcus triatomae]